jgi:hypothetical protein
VEKLIEIECVLSHSHVSNGYAGVDLETAVWVSRGARRNFLARKKDAGQPLTHDWKASGMRLLNRDAELRR